ncbi:hypothetical protein KJ969_00810 [Patescibacteria group bacterium]|nr:hypothetical protein [Patescibacteria group bacterium]
MRGVKRNYGDGSASVKKVAESLAKKIGKRSKAYTCILNNKEYAWLMEIYSGKLVPRRTIREAIEFKLGHLLERQYGHECRIRLKFSVDRKKRLLLTVMLNGSS